MSYTQDMEKYMEKAQVLIEALPYIRQFNRKIIVVKYGGSAMVDEELKKNVIKDVTLLKLVGFKPIIVHGGGKEISKWVRLSGGTPEFVNGLRVTDGKTMEIRPYAQADPVRKIVKDEEKVGAFTTLQRLKTKCRVTTALPTDLTNDLAKRLYEEDAALVAEAIGKGALRPTVVDLSAVTEISNPQPAA